MKRTFTYSYFKPFSATSIGGTITPATRKEAKSLIKKRKLKYHSWEDYEHEKGMRKFTNGRETLYFYAH